MCNKCGVGETIPAVMEMPMTDTRLESMALWILLMLLLMVPLVFE